MNLQDFFLWATGTTEIPDDPLRIFFEKVNRDRPGIIKKDWELIDLIRIGYAFSEYQHKRKINIYQAEWRRKNIGRVREYIKRRDEKVDKESKVEYQKEYYKKKKQQQKNGKRTSK